MSMANKTYFKNFVLELLGNEPWLSLAEVRDIIESEEGNIKDCDWAAILRLANKQDAFVKA